MPATANITSANVIPAPHYRHEARAAASPWLRHVGLLNDFVAVPYANGSVFASQFLYREFRARGQRVTVVGPHDPRVQPEQLPARFITLRSVPLRVHPGVRLPLPSPGALSRLAREGFDLVLGQTATELAQVGVWLRAACGVPFLCVNTIHLPSVYNTLLPDHWLDGSPVDALFLERLVPFIERHSAQVYNETDGLIVLSRGLQQYWRARGVTAPIHVIPRSVEPKIFDRVPGRDPFAPSAAGGSRLLCVCRHSREKALDRLLELFARHVAPRVPGASLTLVGDGPEHDSLRALAVELGVGGRVSFPGEVRATDLPAYYRHADLFVYTSLSETYGQVVSEALWCGLPAVAFADGMGVSDQIEHEQTGVLVAPGPDRSAADEAFALQVVRLLQEPARLHALGRGARLQTRKRVNPERILELHDLAFEDARRHRERDRRSVPDPAAQLRSVTRWATVHAVLAALGCMRKETTINRHGCQQLGWSTLEQAHRALVTAHDGARRLDPGSELACPAE